MVLGFYYEQVLRPRYGYLHADVACSDSDVELESLDEDEKGYKKTRIHASVTYHEHDPSLGPKPDLMSPEAWLKLSARTIRVRSTGFAPRPKPAAKRPRSSH